MGKISDDVRTHKYTLTEDEMPTQWYNIVPDLPAWLRERIVEVAGVETSPQGYVQVDGVSRTNVRGIYAAGDCTGVLLLAYQSEVEVLKDEIRSRPPVLLVHGDSDEMLPAALTEEAAVALQRNGVEVAVHIAQGVGHGIDQTGLSNAARFLLNVLRLPMPQRS